LPSKTAGEKLRNISLQQQETRRKSWVASQNPPVSKKTTSKLKYLIETTRKKLVKSQEEVAP